MILFVICWVQGATSCRDTTIEFAATPAVATSGRNSVAAIVAISQIFRLRAVLNKTKGQTNELSAQYDAPSGTSSASPDINRIPLLFRFRTFHSTRIRVHF